MHDMFRLEHRDAVAWLPPFNKGAYNVSLVRLHLPQTEVHSPPPWDDGLGTYGGRWFFGFQHLAALDVWFPYELRQRLQTELPNRPMVVRHYRGPDVRYGGRQMVMWADTARRVATLDLVKLTTNDYL